MSCWSRFRALKSDITKPITVLQLFLSSPKPVLKFAAIKTLNKLAMSQPGAVAGCNMDIENLITDANRSVATYAITTLLKVRRRHMECCSLPILMLFHPKRLVTKRLSID
jgi:hypothetical protein